MPLSGDAWYSTRPSVGGGPKRCSGCGQVRFHKAEGVTTEELSRGRLQKNYTWQKSNVYALLAAQKGKGRNGRQHSAPKKQQRGQPHAGHRANSSTSSNGFFWRRWSSLNRQKHVAAYCLLFRTLRPQKKRDTARHQRVTSWGTNATAAPF